MSKYNIIYQTHSGPETDFEFQYINEVLFGNLKDKTNTFDNNTCETIEENAVIVYSCDKIKPNNSFLNYIKRINQPVLLHLSNESQNHLFYYYKEAKAVLRSLNWNPFTKYKNVFTVPLGFQSGYLNSIPSEINFDNRKNVWAFAGAIKFDRKKMLSALENFGPNWYFKSSGWGNADIKTTKELIEIYKNALFAPTPFGNINFECFRTMESLEWGCIPVTTKFLGEDCYKYIYGDHPFIVGNDWEDAAMKMKEILKDPIGLKQKQLEVWNWYQAFKKQLSQDVLHIVNGEINLVKGKQFEYQKQARKNTKLKWRFFKHFTLDVYWKRIIGKAIPSKN